MKDLKDIFMYKVIQIGLIEDAKSIELKINNMLKNGMRLEFINDKFMIFIKHDKNKKNEASKP